MVMKYFYRIDGFCEDKFDTLWDVKHHLSMYSPLDLISAKGRFVYRYIVIDDMHHSLDDSFLRRIDVTKHHYANGSSYVKFHLTKVKP